MKEYTEYELIYIVSLEKSESIESIKKIVNDLISKYNGKIIRTSDPQKRKLAYPIKSVKNGIYVITRFQSHKDKIKTINKNLYLENQILRHLIVSAADLPKKERKEEIEKSSKNRKEEINTAKNSKPKEKVEKKKEKPKKEVDIDKVIEEDITKKETNNEKKTSTQDIKKDKVKKKIKEEENDSPEKKEKKEKIKFEDLERKIEDILKDDLIKIK
jgi:ribosomal protein S6